MLSDLLLTKAIDKFLVLEAFKMTHNVYDPEVSSELMYYPKSNTRGNNMGNKYKLLNHTFHYDTRKYSFILFS